MITCNPPQYIQIPEGHRLQLEVTACGTMPLYYQWYFGYITIAGMLYNNMIIYALTSLFALQVKINHTTLFFQSL